MTRRIKRLLTTVLVLMPVSSLLVAWAAQPPDAAANSPRKTELRVDSAKSSGLQTAEVPAPKAPDFLALVSSLGRVVWQDNSAGKSIIVKGSSCSCSETSPAIATIGGVNANTPTDGPQNAVQETNAPEPEQEWGEMHNGLRARVVPVLSSMSEDAIDTAQRVETFASNDDVAFAVEIQNVSDQPIHLLDTRYGDNYGASKGKANSNWYGQFLFSIDLFDGDGKPLERPDVEVVDLNSVLDGALGVSLDPGKTHRFLLRPNKWLSAMTQRVESGNYRAVVRYHGLPARVATRIKEYRPDSSALEAVAGDIVTAQVAFEVGSSDSKPLASANENDDESEAKLIWGEPNNGLRAAMSFLPSKSRYRHGDKPDAKFHVQNVGNEPITLASHLWLSELPATVENEDRERIEVGTAWYSGWTLCCRVILKPQQTIIFDAGNLGLAITKERAAAFEHITNRTLVASPGRYTMQLQSRFGNSFLLKDGKGKVLAPLEGDWVGELKSGVIPLLITNEVIECNIVDASTGKPVADTSVNFRFVKPKFGDVAEEIVADFFWGPKAPSRISFMIPETVLNRSDREEIEVEWGVGQHPDYEDYVPTERISLQQFFREGTKAAHDALGTIKLTPKKQQEAKSDR